MNKLLLKLPNKVLLNYVIKYFSNLSVDDVIEVLKKGIKIPTYCYIKNNEVLASSEVLKLVLENDFSSSEVFLESAFNQENINIIANSQNELYPDFIDKFSFLLDNYQIRIKFIKNYPSYIKNLDDKYFSDEIINIIENSYYVVDREDIKKHPKLLNNEIIIKKAIKEDLSLIFDIPYLNDEIVYKLIDSNYKLTKEDFYRLPLLKNYEYLVKKLYENDPSMIIFFQKELSYQEVMDAYERGFVASEEDLIKQPHLGNNTYIMQYAISKEPKLIRYVKSNCFLKESVIKEALDKYKITKEDLINNPDLCSNAYIMYLLPEFKLYSAYLSEDEKKEAIINCLKNNIEITEDSVPFLCKPFKNNIDINKINELLKVLFMNIDNDNIEVQQNYYNLLDKIIDGIIKIRYENEKNNFKYSNVIDLRNYILDTFINIKNTQNYNLLDDLIEEIYNFVDCKLEKDYIKKEILNYYEVYKVKDNIDLSSEFSNKILNFYRNNYMSGEKNKIILDLIKKLDITSKKKKLILNSKKIEIITYYIKNGLYDKLGITENDFDIILDSLKESIVNNKDIKHNGVIINDDMFEYFKNSFKKYGYIKQDVFNSMNIDNVEVSKYIYNKFERIKIKFLDKVYLKDNINIDKDKLGFNINNFVIGSYDKYLENIAKLILNIDNDTIDDILYNEKYLNEIKDVIPLVGLIDELNIESLINILTQYSRVREKMISLEQNDSNVKDLVYNNFDDLFVLSKDYSSINDVSLFALGKEVSDVLGHKCSEYLEFYKKVLKKETCSIPQVDLKMDNYTFTTGAYSNPERLLIGHVEETHSCINLNNLGGGKTYEEVLTHENADVILIRDNNKLVSRILVFRRGNVIQLVTNANYKFSLDIYKEIARQMLDKAKRNNDNLEYVFVNSYSVKNDNKGIRLEDNRFINKFPHADFSNEAILLNSEYYNKDKKVEDIKLDFDCKVLGSYNSIRKKINYNPTDLEITRLRALRIELEENEIVKEELARDFEVFYNKEYLKAICGEDWYIAIKNDGMLEEVVLPLNNSKSFEEMEKVKNTIHLEKQKGVKI